jgi:hypothetical protein
VQAPQLQASSVNSSLENNSINILCIINGPTSCAKVTSKAAIGWQASACIRLCACAPCGRGAGRGMQVVVCESIRLCMKIVYISRWYMYACASSQMPLLARLFSLLLALHSWRACVCTAARRALIITRGNHTMNVILEHTLASDHLLVICVGTRAAPLAI